MVDIDKRELFVGKKCILEKRDYFKLTGIVLDATFGPGGGVIFETAQKTAFISWQEIVTLIPETVN